jgi:acyl carrier protein
VAPSQDPADTEVIGIVRRAVALVCGVDASTVESGTELAVLGADSLALVSIADVVEAELARSGQTLHIDDATLARMRTVGEIADFASARTAVPAGS